MKVTSPPSPMTTTSSGSDRARLAELLTEAAEIEHDVMCQYLFTAFSMKKSVSEGGVTVLQLEMMRDWQWTLLSIARQEMEHLGIVSNLLTAIGESPYLMRANYPLSSRHYPVHFKSDLTAFSLDTIRRFIQIEAPSPPGPLATDVPPHAADDAAGGDFSSVAALYREIERLFNELAPSGSLFVGPPSAQIGLQNILPTNGFLRGVALPPNARMYDIELMPVLDLPSAVQAIHQVIDEGEGGGKGGNEIPEPQSHFGRFVAMHKALRDEMERDPLFRPARPVVKNPKTRPDATREHGGTVITDPATRRVSELFDAAYRTMLLLLVRFLAHTDESKAEIATLQAVAFFPLMTTVIRPVAELLTQLPVAPGSTDTAGPSFDVPRRIEFLPHRQAAWRVLLMELQYLVDLSKELAADQRYPGAMRERLQLVFENTSRMVLNFSTGMNVPVPA